NLFHSTAPEVGPFFKKLRQAPPADRNFHAASTAGCRAAGSWNYSVLWAGLVGAGACRKSTRTRAGMQTIRVYRPADIAIACGAERTHLRFILSQTSSDWPDIAIVRGSGQWVAPRSARNRSMTPSSSARQCDCVTGNGTARRGPACFLVIIGRPMVCGLHAAVAGRTTI